MAWRIVLLLLVAAVIDLTLAGRCLACIIVVPPCAPGQENTYGKINIADELAVIIWDKESKTQHFIRQAMFSSSNGEAVKNLGFIVPTPNLPKLEEADPAIFHLAHTVSRERIYPPVVYYTPFDYAYKSGLAIIALLLSVYFFMYCWYKGQFSVLSWIFLAVVATVVVFGALRQLGTTVTSVFSKITSNLSAASDVDVLHRQRVAGMDATVLQATDSRALVEWLRINGYESPAGFDKWLAPYVAGKWVITAFKLAPADTDQPGKLTGSAVRMSFTTDEPFFPYSELQEPAPAPTPTPVPIPAARSGESSSSSSQQSRVLRVAVLSNERVEGSPLKEIGSDNPVPWPGTLLYGDTSTPGHDSLEVPRGNAVAAQEWLGLAKLTEDPIAQRFPTRLTYFVDESLRKTSGDLIFTPAKDQTHFRRSRIYERYNTVYIYKGDDPLQNSLAFMAGVVTAGLSMAILRRSRRLLEAQKPS